MVSYSVPDFLQKPNATVSVVACFSAYSQFDRAWRKGNPANLAVSHPTPHQSPRYLFMASVPLLLVSRENQLCIEQYAVSLLLPA